MWRARYATSHPDCCNDDAFRAAMAYENAAGPWFTTAARRPKL